MDKETGFALWESRAIMKYLVDKVSPGHSLYPKDLKTRASIDRWLYFDIGSFGPVLHVLMKTAFLQQQPLKEADVASMDDKLKVLNDALASTWCPSSEPWQTWRSS